MSRTTVTFNGQDLTASYHVSDLRTSLLPRRVESVNVPGMDGAHYTGAPLDVRTITLTLSAMGTDVGDRQDAGRTLAGILNVSEPKPLAISIDGGLYYMAMPASSGDAARFYNATQFEVDFTCFDPVAYGTERTVTVPSGSNVTFTVNGTYPTMPTISVPQATNGAQGFWRLSLEDGSYLIATIPTGVQNAPIVADCANRVLKVNGNVVILQPEADWLVLTPGQHKLTMVGGGAATVTYRERWV